MPILGQYLNSSSPTYIKLPDETLRAGEALDAGTIMLLTNNLSVLQKENTRQLVSCFTHFVPPKASTVNNYYTGLTDIDPPPDPTTASINAQISWDKRCSVMFGPFFSVRDRQLSSGLIATRDVKITIDYYNKTASPTLDLYCAITTTEEPPTTGYLACSKHSISTVGYGSYTTVLGCSSRAIGDVSVPSRGGETSATRPIFVWIGMANNAADIAGNSFSTIRSIHVWETREQE